MLNWLKNKMKTTENSTALMDPEIVQLQEHAELGDAEAQYQLGLLY